MTADTAHYVTPTVREGLVFCDCHAEMESIRHVDLESWAVWLWWRCLDDPGHVSHAVPVPLAMLGEHPA